MHTSVWAGAVRQRTPLRLNATAFSGASVRRAMVATGEPALTTVATE